MSRGDQVIASGLPLALVIVAIIGLGVTGNLFSLSPFVIVAQVAAVALNVWARVSFHKGTFRVTANPAAGSIIRNGPYRFIRHPMYSAVLLFVWAGIASHLSALTLAVGAAVTVICLVRVIVEERLLRATFPDYVDYEKSTSALIPLIY